MTHFLPSASLASLTFYLILSKKGRLLITVGIAGLAILSLQAVGAAVLTGGIGLLAAGAAVISASASSSNSSLQTLLPAITARRVRKPPLKF
ncbi:hypothetical protein FNT36_17290 [Hymenobacter setariae]|uniref:Uncharacterized protein n=1 Tax=Hymenobacter setariae TaxID=2594794 RepID=A0A558BSB2_9BACT|nr:hypothetical protein [Hymenobacter setariae]TVT39408.1 hypothetical protein FNT36_17290 [Hymenobacter setariae]